jgi:NhaC family Na+:H+ antiporter
MFWALVPILCMTALMIYVFGWVADSETYDAAHLPLLCSIVVACIVGIAYGRSFKYMLEGIIERLLVSMEAILILLLVGLLISSFMISGTIPALIYYGLALLTPQTFLPIGCIICAVVGWACGSSWTATATVGIAFMTIGTGLGIDPALCAGMVISGAYVGDKFSPLSDTTNLAAAVSGTGLFDHVRAMASTTGPVFLIALVLYGFLGMNAASTGYDPAVAKGIQDAIAGAFNISPIVLLPVLVLLMLYPAHGKVLLAVAAALYFSARLIFIFKGFRIFYSNLSSILYFLLYLCAVEIVPLVIMTSVTYWICGILL